MAPAVRKVTWERQLGDAMVHPDGSSADHPACRYPWGSPAGGTLEPMAIDYDALGRVICVANGKGGVNKTSIVANLGGLAAAGGYRTLLVDLDPQGDLSDDLGYYDNPDDDHGQQLAAALLTGSAADRDARRGPARARCRQWGRAPHRRRRRSRRACVPWCVDHQSARHLTCPTRSRL